MIGIDEAGYGPNLGPLVVGATVWRVHGRVQGSGFRVQEEDSTTILAPTETHTKVDLYERLGAFVSSHVAKDRLAIADSKSLYKPRGGLQLLERGVLSALQITNGKAPRRWRELLANCPALPWYADYECELPVDAAADEIDEVAAGLQETCSAADVSLEAVRSRMVFPREFNELTGEHGTKGAALSHVTIALLRKAIDSLTPEPRTLNPTLTPPYISVSCDKHGGRNRYAALLQHHFPEHWIETHEESRGVSAYAWGPPEGRVSVTFRARGETELPTALASMTAKYHRELAMRAFNKYWCGQVEGLAPTAGYPQDAKRFKQEIAEQQKLAGIEDADLWRNR